MEIPDEPPHRPASPEPARGRSTYRHGDLRRALLDAGIELARDGGPDAVALREVTRRAGVVPNAAYRHFASRRELLLAVRAAALSAAASAMEKELAVLPCDQPPVDFARAQVRAIGTGYLRFAQAEPGLFRTAFVVSSEDAEGEVGPGKEGPAARIRSSCWARRSTGSWKQVRSTLRTAPMPNTWPGRPCTAWRC